jgi:hypothetical protein
LPKLILSLGIPGSNTSYLGPDGAEERRHWPVPVLLAHPAAPCGANQR